MKIYNKFVESKTEPTNKNDIWFDGSVFKIYKEGEWQAVTVDKDIIANIINQINSINIFQLVPELPEQGDTHTIYLVLNKEGIEGNKLLEYVYTDYGWEEVGSFSSNVSLDDMFEEEIVTTTEQTKEFPQVLYVPQNLTIEQQNTVQDNIGVTAKLTELSAEVSVLSERIDNLPSGESSVFEAVYGETTYDEVVEAKNAGKFVICIKDRLTYHLSYVSEDLAYFTTIRGNVSYATYINKATNKWTDALYSLEQLSNKVTSLSSASTDTQYPSAKAVYDFVQTTLGTIINGDY